MQKPAAHSPEIDQRHVHEMLASFSSMMLGTFEDHGSGAPSLHARPMSVAKLEDDCSLQFITAVQSSKVDEAQSQPTGYVFAQNTTRYITLRGTYRVSQDRARMRRLWSKAMDAWFDGPDDPSACILSFTPTEAELWDTSGTRGLRYLFSAAKAIVTGDKPPHSDSEQHAKVTLSH